MDRNSKVFVAGHRGLAGSAMVRRLRNEGYENLVLRARPELDLRNQGLTVEFFEQEKPDYVVIAAARVGGILANKENPGEFIYDNTMITMNVVHAAYQVGVKKLVFLGSNCIYPRACPQPMQEASLLTGPLEPTNAPYAVSKIAGLTLCDAYNRQYGTDFISVIPAGLYGPNDDFDLATCHVLPALLRRFHEAKERGDSSVTLWGTGSPIREFMHADDLASALLFLLRDHHAKDLGSVINIGTGLRTSVKELAERIRDVVGFEGKIEFDVSKPDGMPEKRLDSQRMTTLGWKPQVGFDEGLSNAYRWFLENVMNGRST